MISENKIQTEYHRRQHRDRSAPPRCVQSEILQFLGRCRGKLNRFATHAGPGFTALLRCVNLDKVRQGSDLRVRIFLTLCINMKKSIVGLLCACNNVVALAQNDAPGCKDNPMFNRMPNTEIVECSSNFDELDIPLADEKKETREGTKTAIQYVYMLEEATAPSFFQIVRNFENAITRSGGKRIYYSKDAGVATFATKARGKDVWVVLSDFSGSKRGNFELVTLEIEGMKQDIRADEMLESINKNGLIALQINFETGKSDIKPDSFSIVDQIAAMLAAERTLKVSIEGHTDNTGTAQSNKTLSENRAKAVVAALVAKNIDRNRLSSKGWGQEKPLTDNSKEEGKARNRRVEIVKVR